jgi:hypothetical protein
MVKRLKGKAKAIVALMVLALVALMGFMIPTWAADTVIAAEPVVTITDNLEPTDDHHTYSDGYFVFNVTDWWEGDIPDLAEYTAEIMIDNGTPVEMTYETASDSWVYNYTNPPAGEHIWEIQITNTTSTDMVSVKNGTDMPLISRDHPEFVSGEDIEFEEDTVYTWNLTAMNYFSPDDLTIEEPVIVENETNIDIADVSENGYVIWEITPAENWNGVAKVNVTASDPWGESVTHTFMITVTSVNDKPVIDYIMYDDMEKVPEWTNVTTAVDDEGNTTDWMWVWLVELNSEEDMDTNFTIVASDIETKGVENFTYAVEKYDVLDPYTVTQNETVTNMFYFTPDANESGIWWANATVEDQNGGVAWTWIQFNVTGVDDAPTGEIIAPTQMVIDVKTGVNVTMEASVSDIDTDMENLTVTWMEKGTELGTGTTFTYKWTTPGLYVVDCYVSDGVYNVEIGNRTFNVSIANTAPTIINITVSPTTIYEGDTFTLTVNYEDEEENVDSIVWSLDTNASWSMEGKSIQVTQDLAPGDHVFTVVVTDEQGETATDSITINVKEKEQPVEEEDEESSLWWLWILIGVIVIFMILVVIILVVLGGKKEEKMPQTVEETPVEEGMEQPMGEEGMGEQPMYGEQPPAPEEPTAEEEIPQEPPAPQAPPQPPQAPPQPPQTPPQYPQQPEEQ